MRLYLYAECVKKWGRYLTPVYVTVTPIGDVMYCRGVVYCCFRLYVKENCTNYVSLLSWPNLGSKYG